jgi:hypothetical protein
MLGKSLRGLMARIQGPGGVEPVNLTAEQQRIKKFRKKKMKIQFSYTQKIKQYFQILVSTLRMPNPVRAFEFLDQLFRLNPGLRKKLSYGCRRELKPIFWRESVLAVSARARRRLPLSGLFLLRMASVLALLINLRWYCKGLKGC